MKYLVLIRVDEKLAAKRTAADGEAVMRETLAWVEETQARGARIIGDRVQPVEKARIVRERGGRLSVTDGPFAEVKEQIGGFDILECGSMKEAEEIASRHPARKFGAIEVREVWPLQ